MWNDNVSFAYIPENIFIADIISYKNLQQFK
jgi:hypothetical protein